MWSESASSQFGKGGERAYLLLDVVLAVTIFAIAVTGMLVAINRITETSKFYAQDMQLQYGMDAMLVEARHRPLEQMAFERHDSHLEVVYRSELEALNEVNSEGEALDGLYRLKVSAVFTRGGEDEGDSAEVIVYRPEEEGK